MPNSADSATKNDTEAEMKAFAAVLRRNIKHRHGLKRLPRVPYFLKNCKNPKIEAILTQLLYDSKSDTKEFLEKATLILLLHKEEKESQSVKMACLVRENIDIREKLKRFPKVSGQTRGSVKVIDSHSSFGNISCALELDGLAKNIELGESHEGKIDIKNEVEIEVYLETADSNEKVDEFRIFFGSALKDVNYMSVFGKRSFSKLYPREHNLYNLTLEVKLDLSEDDSKELLLQHLYDNEKMIEKENEVDDLYQILLDQFGILDNGREISSSIVEKPQRDCCGFWPF